MVIVINYVWVIIVEILFLVKQTKKKISINVKCRNINIIVIFNLTDKFI